MLLLIFSLLTLVSVVPLAVALRPSSSSKLLKSRLIAVRDGSLSVATGAPLLDLSAPERTTWTDAVATVLERLGIAESTRRLISHAGSEMSLGTFVLASVLLALGFGIAVLLFFPHLPVVLAAAVFGFFVPGFLMRFRRAKRLSKFTDALPEAIELMARSLRAGHAVGAAIEIVAEQGQQPLAGEFDRVFQQQRFGLRFRDALLEMAERIPSSDLHFLITAVLVQRETGGDLPDILDRTADVIRERVRIAGEVRVHTAQGRLTGWILSLMPVALLVLINIVDPGYSKMLFHDPTGIKLLYAGAGCISFGAFVISRIVKVEV